MSQSSATPATTDQPQQDAKGKFLPGNKCGRGNPFARQCEALRVALLHAVTDIAQIAARLLEKAKAGDAAAARVLFSYTIGKPAPVVDPDTLDRQELSTLAQNRTDTAHFQRVITVPSADLTLSMLDVVLPLLDIKHRNRVRSMAAATLPEVMQQKYTDPQSPYYIPGFGAEKEGKDAKGSRKAAKTLEQALGEQREQRETINKYLEPKTKKSKKRNQPQHKAQRQAFRCGAPGDGAGRWTIRTVNTRL